MDSISQLDRYGLFNSRAPRYTSYPPANHFLAKAGGDIQREGLAALKTGDALSLYIHVPFCKRLCWFCACRTQGTPSMRPVEDYVGTLRKELEMVANSLQSGVLLSRLHLGGGTPTILTEALMRDLLQDIFDRFGTAEGFEFSVEIDPTDCTAEMVTTLAQFGMNRASIGVQDFAPRVQRAVGRIQTVEDTATIIWQLRDAGVESLNIDLLYGLPFQTMHSLRDTLDIVQSLGPDRLAVFGYAHVPKISKRQVMIPADALPDGRARYALAEQARAFFIENGFDAIGIDHFAKPEDSLAIAAREGRLKRNFQGYTDDPAEVILGIGASSISQFPHGYAQNAVSTSAYRGRIDAGELASDRGYRFRAEDQLRAAIIADLLCRFAIDEAAILAAFPEQAALAAHILSSLKSENPEVIIETPSGLALTDEARPLARIIAGQIDAFAPPAGMTHSAAS